MSTAPSSLPAPLAATGRLSWVLMVVLASLISLASTRYVLGGAVMVPQPLKPNFLGHQSAFLIHIAAASVALAIGPWQFLGALRRRYPLIHRAMGGVYVGACFIGGLAAFPMAVGSNGGPVAAAGFLALASLWLFTTARALAAVLAGNIPAHRRWMVRSFALTLAGVTLRLYLPVALAGVVAFPVAYAAIAWLCWLPNLIVADRFAAVGRQRQPMA